MGEPLRAEVSAAGHTTNLWPLLVNNARAVVAVDDEGLRVFAEGSDPVQHRWSELEEVRVEQLALCVLVRDDQVPIRYPLMHMRDRRGLAESVAAAGAPIRSNAEQVLPAAASPAPGRSGEPPAANAAASSARAMLTTALIAGLAGQAVGWSIIGVAYGSVDDETVPKLLGIAVATLGGFALLLAVIGWGVVLGTRITRDET
ncbi:hypothetical protein [Nocardioides sp. LHG3406-4]|uniref:hypothetical protein n=1 Tax=Nocardioides sp. LHG3406-4 TaxID=2804575 RepID=UPI003CEDA1BB